MRLLLISYFFPPDKLVGGYRASSFCKYFKKKNIEISLLTSNKVISEDQDLQKKYNLSSVHWVKRSRLREIGYKFKFLAFLELFDLDKYLFFPDVYFPWIGRAIRKGKKAIKENNIEGILVTAPPFSCFTVAYKLAQKSGLPLILDYRDPWSGSPFISFPKEFIKKRHLKLEKKIVEVATLSVSVGEKCANMIEESLNIPKKTIEIIYNGYFPEDIPKNLFEKERKIFTISFVGNFYSAHQSTFRNFAKGLSIMTKRHNLTEEDIVFQYAGSTSRSIIKRILQSAKVYSFFKDLGYLSKEKTNEIIQRSNLVFLLYPKNVDYALPTKLYDYALGNSHMLLISEKVDHWEVLDDINQNYTQALDKPEDIAEKLWGKYLKWRKDELEYGCDKVKLRRYNRKNMADKLANLIKERIPDSKE